MTSGPLERETCRDVVMPALVAAGWGSTDIREQYPVKATRTLRLGRSRRDLGDGFIDYALEVDQVPVAVVEAKRAHRSASDGLQQAVRYAQQLDVPLAYATNGDEIIERDMVTGRERRVEGFAPPVEAWSRFARLHGLDAAGQYLQARGFNREKRLATGDVQEPRWYQAVAIRRVLTAIGRGERRVLLLMATGTGKTFTAMQIVHMLREHAEAVSPERNHRVLYLADRDQLVEAPMTKDFKTAFGDGPLRRVSREADNRREIYFATYQAMAGGDDADALFRGYAPDFFDLVVVDECHRGSASENSSWRRILDYFSSAVQLGLTATPKQDDTVDTFRYFGDPVFTYSLRQGIEEGYLAPYRVRRVTLSPDADGWEPSSGQLDQLGRQIPEGRYSTRDFERVVRLLARTDLAARYLVRLLRRDPTARTIVFCVDVAHAEAMRYAMAQAAPDLMSADPEWVVRIVGVEEEKKRLLPAFCDPESDSPVVATTSRLLSTGIDVPDLKYVVLFRPVGSPVEFKQIIGRGTRLYPEAGKTSFEIIDFVGATVHFADPDFDGYPVNIRDDPPLDEGQPVPFTGEEPDMVAEPAPEFTAGNPGMPADEGGEAASDGLADGPPPARQFVVDDGSFHIVSESVFVPDTSTGRLTLTEYGEFVAGEVRRIAASPDELATQWSRSSSRDMVRAALERSGIALDELLPAGERALDPLDLLVQLAWDVPARTRSERARRVRERHHDDLERRSEMARAVLSVMLDLYAERGIDEVTSPELLALPEIMALGSRRQIAGAFGGPAGLHAAVDELQTWIYSDKTAS